MHPASIERAEVPRGGKSVQPRDKRSSWAKGWLQAAQFQDMG